MRKWRTSALIWDGATTKAYTNQIIRPTSRFAGTSPEIVLELEDGAASNAETPNVERRKKKKAHSRE